MQSMLADKDGYQAAGAALGGCLAFLKDAMLDKQVGGRAGPAGRLG